MRFVPCVRTYEAPARIWPGTRIFESFFKDFPTGLFDRDEGIPAVDIQEKDGNLVLKAEVPGMDEKDIQIQLEGNVLTLKGEKRLKDENERESYRRIESYYGSFSRSFTLPDTADRDKITAEYKNGVLKITIPQKPETKAREIPVTTH